MDQARHHNGMFHGRYVRSLRIIAESLHTARDFVLNRSSGRFYFREELK